MSHKTVDFILICNLEQSIILIFCFVTCSGSWPLPWRILRQTPSPSRWTSPRCPPRCRCRRWVSRFWSRNKYKDILIGWRHGTILSAIHFSPSREENVWRPKYLSLGSFHLNNGSLFVFQRKQVGQRSQVTSVWIRNISGTPEPWCQYYPDSGCACCYGPTERLKIVSTISGKILPQP